MNMAFNNGDMVGSHISSKTNKRDWLVTNLFFSASQFARINPVEKIKSKGQKKLACGHIP
ncbi:hypothetical protein [Peribacillus sp. NPDC096448]|uniref:hypothetical protein n=1 Tax=Peribacillus sp. NPDC096448 TaxID=3364395 RepID=UPI00380AA844